MEIVPVGVTPPLCVPTTPKIVTPEAIFAAIRFVSPEIVCAPVKY
jgi:hypothetical protein